MERKYEIYAKQLDPDYVNTDIYLNDYVYENSDYAIDGGRHFKSFNDAIINNAKQCVEYYYELEYGYHKNATEFFEYYLHSTLTKKLTPKQVGYLKREMERNDLSTTDHEENFILAVYKVIKGCEYGMVYLRGSMQGDVVKLYAPKKDDFMFDYLEALYWNLGSEIEVHEFDGEVNEPDDIAGYTIYVNSYDAKELKQAVAHNCNVREEDVCLWLFDGYIKTEKYVKA